MIVVKKIRTACLVVGGFFLFLDQLCKILSKIYLKEEVYLIKPWLGLEVLNNQGVAFGIPIPNCIVILLTFFIIILLALAYLKQVDRRAACIGIFFIYCGAVSNLIDRLFLGYTVDYIRIVFSVINLADIMIVVGIFLLFWERRILHGASHN